MLKLIEGDCFPISKEEVGIGQIIKMPNKYSFIMGVYDCKLNVNEVALIDNIIKTPLIFMGYSNDAKLYHNDWKVIGNSTSNFPNILLPYYRLGVPPNDIYLVNYMGLKLLPIDESVFNKLSYQTEIAPIRYENALKAYYGLQEWIDDDYNKIFYSNVLVSNEIFKKLSIAYN